MHPILFNLGENLPIASYGVLIALGLLAGVALACWRGKARGFSPDSFMDLAFIAGLSGFIGGRILFILLDLPGFFASPAEYIFSRTGFVFLGGFFAAAVACTWYVRKKKLDFWMTGDIMVIALAVAHGFGRIGCHFSGCCFGGVCSAPLAIRVPAVDGGGGHYWPNAFSEHLAKNLLPPGATESLPIWPVQLFEAGGLFLIAGILFWVGARVHRRGLILGLYLLLYPALRFGLEFLRGDEVRGLWFGGMLSTSQLISIALFAVGIAIVATQKRREPWVPIPAPAEKKTPPILHRRAKESGS